MTRVDEEQTVAVIDEAAPVSEEPAGAVARGASSVRWGRPRGPWRPTASSGPAATGERADSSSPAQEHFIFRKPRDQIEDLLRRADVIINGDRPWDLQVHDERMYSRVLLGGSLALGESYMDGWWDSEKLDECFHRILRAGLEGKVRPWVEPVRALGAALFNLQKPSRAFQVGQRHYDIGNDLYRRMLGERMIYSCGYWRNASTLDEAQEAKLDLVFRKLHLRPGMRILDIGCGWGGAAKFAAERYGVSVVGLTISQEQAELARETCKGLDVDIRLQDYRDVLGIFDRIFSIGMVEHVGRKNYDRYFAVARLHLKEDGLFLLHTIGGNRSVSRVEPWIGRHIFPNSMLPSAAQICQAIEGEWVIEDWHNFGPDYDPTLMCWYENFQEHWSALKGQYDERFYRMWRYYLLSCAGSFRARKNQVWQIVLSPRGLPRTYTVIR